MSSVAEIAAKTANIGEHAGRVAMALDYEAGEITALTRRIQGAFGDQSAGQEAVRRLNSAFARTVAASSALRNEKARGVVFVAKLRS